jgi:CHAT domain
VDYLDFEVEIDEARDGAYRVSVLFSPAGQTRAIARFPASLYALRERLGDSQRALLEARGGRDVVPVAEPKVAAAKQAAREVGQALSVVLFTGEVGDLYVQSLDRAKSRPDRGLRLKLRAATPELAALPWELVSGPRGAGFLCLSNATPLVRYLPLPQPPAPLAVQLPLRILGMVASPTDLPQLNVDQEMQRIEEAIADARSRRLIELVWIEEPTVQALHQRLQPGAGPWHIFHFIGHGGFSPGGNEGYLALCERDGRASELTAETLGDLVHDHPSLRLAVLNACEGARGSASDLFSSTAARLVSRGLPAVVSMQHKISDPAAIELAREFYRKLAQGFAVDASLAEARKAVSIELPRSVEWGTPVLHLRAPDGKLFDINQTVSVTPPSSPPPQLEVSPTLVNFGTVEDGSAPRSVSVAIRNAAGGSLAWSYQQTGDFFFIERTTEGLKLTLIGSEGTHRGSVRITSNGAEAIVGVFAKIVAPHPVSIFVQTWQRLSLPAKVLFVPLLFGALTSVAAKLGLWSMPRAGIAFDGAPTTLEAGATAPLRVTGTGGDKGVSVPPGDLAWSSSDTTVLRVDPSGVAYAVAAGSAFVLASRSGDTTRAFITVPPAKKPETVPPANKPETMLPANKPEKGTPRDTALVIKRDSVLITEFNAESGTVRLSYWLAEAEAVLGFYVEQFPTSGRVCANDARYDVYRANEPIRKGTGEVQFQIPKSSGAGGLRSFGINFWSKKNGKAYRLIKTFPQYTVHCWQSN